MILLLAVLSAVLSTMDSAILSPATVLAQNLFRREGQAHAGLGLHQLCVAGVTAASLGVAYLGQDAYSLLESAYEVGLVSLFAPLALGLLGAAGGERSALAAMVVGTGLWLAHRVAGYEGFLARDGMVPVGLACAGCASLAYAVTARLAPHGLHPPEAR